MLTNQLKSFNSLLKLTMLNYKMKKDNCLMRQEIQIKINQSWKKKINLITIINQLMNRMCLNQSLKKNSINPKILKKIKFSNVKNKLNHHKNLINNKSHLKINTHHLQMSRSNLKKSVIYHQNINKPNKNQLKKVVQAKNKKKMLS